MRGIYLTDEPLWGPAGRYLCINPYHLVAETPSINVSRKWYVNRCAPFCDHTSICLWTDKITGKWLPCLNNVRRLVVYDKKHDGNCWTRRGGTWANDNTWDRDYRPGTADTHPSGGDDGGDSGPSDYSVTESEARELDTEVIEVQVQSQWFPTGPRQVAGRREL